MKAPPLHTGQPGVPGLHALPWHAPEGRWGGNWAGSGAACPAGASSFNNVRM